MAKLWSIVVGFVVVVVGPHGTDDMVIVAVHPVASVGGQ